VEVVLEQRQDVLTVPVSAVQQDAETPYVWVKDAENLAQRRDVVVGLETLEAIEIVSGLQEGDEVVAAIPPDVNLSPGQPLGEPGSDGAAGMDDPAGGHEEGR
jgi:HlyD family secretion protein